MRFDVRIAVGALAAAALAVVWPLVGPSSLWLDFILAGVAFGALVGALRWSAARQSIDQDVGPGQHHEARTVPQWDPDLLASHEAVAAYLEHADGEALASRVPEGEVRRRLRSLLDRPPPRPVLLIHPAWNYAGLALGLALFMASIAAGFVDRFDVPVRLAVALGLMGLGTGAYVRTWNRYGGPWWLAAAWGVTAVGAVVAGIAMLPGLWGFLRGEVPEITVPALLVLVAAPATAYLYDRRRPPQYVAKRMDIGELQQLRRQELRGVVTTAVVGALSMAILLALLAIQAIRGEFRGFLELAFGVIPGAIMALTLPRLARVLGLTLGGPASLQRLQRRREQRSQRLIRLLTDVPT